MVWWQPGCPHRKQCHLVVFSLDQEDDKKTIYLAREPLDGVETKFYKDGENMTWRNKTIAFGAVAGLLIGIAAAYIVIQRAERENTIPQITAGDGVKVGLGLLGVLRLIADIGEPE